MINQRVIVVVLAAAVVVLLALFLPVRSMPDFSAIPDIDERKATFFDFLLPHVESANREIVRKRGYLKRISRRSQYGAVNKRDLHWLSQQAYAHGIDVDDDTPDWLAVIQQLDLRMDVIPPSMALAQAALESGWGTSRFARKANNLFGIRCWEPGCGIVPGDRPAGAGYEVERYRSPARCFLRYIEILNGNPAYRQMWALRRNARENGELPEGSLLMGGLSRYSTQGQEYINRVRRVISANQLQAYDAQVGQIDPSLVAGGQGMRHYVP